MLSALIVSALSSCGGSGDDKPAFVTVLPSATSVLPTTTAVPGATTTTGPRARTLEGICPNPVVIQLDTGLDLWATPYASLTTTDGVSDGLRYRGPLVDPLDRTPTGVDVEIRTLGALPAGTSVETAVLGDPSVLLGATDVTTMLPASNLRAVLVAAPWARGDLALRWKLSSATSGAKTVGDLAGTVIANPELAPSAAAYLQASGLLPRKRDVSIVRPDASALGTTGEATLVHLLEDPVRNPPLVEGVGLDRAQLLAEVGWEPLPHALVARPASLDERHDCLREVVPLIQRAVLRTARQPAVATEQLARVAAKAGIAYNQEMGLQQLQAALTLELLGIGNEAGPITADVTSGRLVQIAKAQVLASRVLKPRLTTPQDLNAITSRLVDRRFLDSSVSYDADAADLARTTG